MTDRRWFTGALVLVVGLLLVQTLALPPASRLAPLWVLVPTAVLLLVQLALDLSPRARDRPHPTRATGVSDAGPRIPAGETESATAVTPSVSRWTREARVVFWIAWLVSLLYLLGFVLATALFLLPYLLRESAVGWGRSVVLTAIATGVTYLVFDVVARVPFPPGVLF